MPKTDRPVRRVVVLKHGTTLERVEVHTWHPNIRAGVHAGHLIVEPGLGRQLAELLVPLPHLFTYEDGVSTFEPTGAPAPGAGEIELRRSMNDPSRRRG